MREQYCSEECFHADASTADTCIYVDRHMRSKARALILRFTQAHAFTFMPLELYTGSRLSGRVFNTATLSPDKLCAALPGKNAAKYTAKYLANILRKIASFVICGAETDE